MQKQPYMEKQNSTLFQNDPRARVVLQKARLYGVSPLSNEYLLSELFMLENDFLVSNKQIEVFSKFIEACYESVQEAQMSK